MKKVFAILILSLSLLGCSANVSNTKTSTDAASKPTATDASKSNPADNQNNQDASKQNATDTSSQSKSGESSKDTTGTKDNASTEKTNSQSKSADSGAHVAVKIISVSTPAPRNSTVTVTAKVTPNATAHITVENGGNTSHAAGLEAHKADANGTVSWSWHVSETAALDTIPIKVTCDGTSATTKFTVVQ